MMTFIDLFAGVGGFRYGMELAGHKCVGFCEWDKYATMSYTMMHLATEEQREYIKTLDFKKRQKELLENGEKYRNGEWYSNDIRNVHGWNMPRADVLCFGAPCQDFSLAGARKGLNGDRSILVKEVFRIISEQEESDRPEWLIYENVKGMLSSNKGWDYAGILIEMVQLGYDVEYQVFNSKYFGVPQNRERVYTIGHLRSRGERKILPISGNNREIGINQIMKIVESKWKNPTVYRVYNEKGVSPSLVTNGGGGHVPYVREVKVREATKKGYSVAQEGDSINFEYPNSTTRRGRVGEKVAQTLTTSCNQGTLYKEIIRKLTPRECFRLQGWHDEYYERAALVNSDSKLYSQAGNGVTTTVVYEIAKRL